MKNNLSNTIRSLIILSVMLPFDQLLAQPTITSFEPASGPVGTSVTITGTGFNVNPAENEVFFGATQAVVSEASSSSLTALVPFGATYKPLTVIVNGLVEYASDPFIVTFDGGGTIDMDSFKDKEDLDTGETPWAVSSCDLDGDGINDNAMDDDGDGIPNGQDPDYTRPQDGSGRQNKFGSKSMNQNGKGSARDVITRDQ